MSKHSQKIYSWQDTNKIRLTEIIRQGLLVKLLHYACLVVLLLKLPVYHHGVS